MDITMLKSLRERTGLGLAQCKEALSAAGDLEGALAWLRERGLFKEPPLEGHRLREALETDDHVRISEWLADQDRGSDTLVDALRTACVKGAIENVRLLLAAGADRTAVLERPWLASQVEVMRVMFDGVHRARRLRALKASLTSPSLVDGTDAVVWLAEGLTTEQLEGPLLAPRIVMHGCEELMARWSDPEAKLREALPDEDAKTAHALLGPTNPVTPRTFGEMLVAFRDHARSICQVIDEMKEEGERSYREAEWLARRARLEACVARWGTQRATAR